MPDLADTYARLQGASPGTVRRLLELARDEDLSEAGDLTCRLCFDEQPGPRVAAAVRARQTGVLAGWAAVEELLEVFGGRCEAVPGVPDGGAFEPGLAVGTIIGPASDVLTLERTLLNLLSRLSGIATLTRQYVDAIGDADCQLLDTRKTTPGHRTLEKYAVACGGGTTHRTGLYDAILVKDNHLALAGDDLAGFLTNRLANVARYDSAFVEIEVDTLQQLEQVLNAARLGAPIDYALVDNMTPAELRQAVAMRDGAGVDVKLEASGGITLATIGEVAQTGVERISTGAITHQAQSIDLGLDID